MRDHVFESLRLKFILMDEERVTEVFELLGNAIHKNNVKDLELDMSVNWEDMDDHDSSDVFVWLKNLTIRHLSFAAPPDLDNLLKSCKQLEILKMVTCDCQIAKPWAIDAPESLLRCLVLEDCDFGLVSLLCLPKLEHLSCSDWYIKNNARLGQEELVLSKFLANTPNIEQLSLGFGAERIWIQEERVQLLQDIANPTQL
ncbi:hypothetical protein EJB05_10587, partial [Eragrostis curvula]